MVDKLHDRGVGHSLWVWLVCVVFWAGCASPPEKPTVTLKDKTGETIIEYIAPENPDDPVLGATDGGLYLVRGQFVKDALNDKNLIKDLRGRLREQELKE